MKDKLMSVAGHFIWSFGCEFFIETEIGNFVWSDPDYNGDNTIRPFNGNYHEWCNSVGIPYGRDKGVEFISSYCGDSWEYKNE